VEFQKLIICVDIGQCYQTYPYQTKNSADKKADGLIGKVHNGYPPLDFWLEIIVSS